ncbi:MAG: alpha-amylase family glycosyl hydrolase [Kiritimatiellae bacterium]|nr:alpha-amylase family glycosyl hydrolase [Kiritimatiellia bacterium]
MSKSFIVNRLRVLFIGVLFAVCATPVQAEVMLQLFNTSWRDMAEKMPELAEAGYGSLWIPPPTKGSGALSVGYDLWDPFDLGGKDQRNTVRTRYGTEAELLDMIETAHRFGIRIYIDNIMNHRAFDIPGYNETTPIDLYPGMVPEDFHLRKTEDGFYRKWDNVADWNDAWQVQNRNFSDLIDISQETPNANFGAYEGQTYPKVSFVRQPNNPEFYDYHPDLGYLGFGNTNITQGLLSSNTAYYTEDVGGYLVRAARWLMEKTKADGLRLDAVKHVPDYFFGQQSGVNKDESSDGYVGQAQLAFNRARGFNGDGLDNNHRDSVFNTEAPRDDAMMFGEHLGSPPGFGGYIDAGMRLKDAPLRDHLNGMLGESWGNLSGLEVAGGGSPFGSGQGVQFAHSHDSDYSKARELQYAFYMTRAGLPNVYSDGNFQSETLAQSGGAFPRHANTAFLGQFGDARLPNLAYINNHFARGDQVGVWGDNDYLAYHRIDKRENGSMSDADGATMLFLVNDNYSSGASRSILGNVKFGKTPFTDDVYLYNYSTYGGGFFVYASMLGSVVVPPGGYFVFAPRTPEETDAWRGIGGKPVEIFQNGQRAPTVSYTRRDGPNGDPNFNPNGVPNDTLGDYAYTWTVPRVTSGTNLRFVARVDGSAGHVMMKLDGGIDINSQMGMGETNNADWALNRENRPGKATDVFLGYEDLRFVQRTHGREKFAAKDSARAQYNSAGAESYQVVIGTAGVTNYNAYGANDWTNSESVMWAYHDAAATINLATNSTLKQMMPEPQSAANQPVSIWVKTGNKFDASKAFLYYTTDGQTFPEGAAGLGVGSTKVVEMGWAGEDKDNSQNDWWQAVLPAMPNGTTLRYKVGFWRQQNGDTNRSPWYIVQPQSGAELTRKMQMIGEWEAADFNAKTVKYKPHADYSTTATGLVEGFHIARARAFLDRPGKASLYNTFAQTFYFDTQTPTGQIVFAATNGTVMGSQEYGFVVRADSTVRGVYFNVLDGQTNNDDKATGNLNGNGIGTNGQPSWVAANRVTPSLEINSPYPDEYRFTYRNIPASGVATVQVRLVEISSSTNFALSDSAGWYTTLQRVVLTQSPTQALFVAYPENDGMLINDQWDYVMRVRFSKSLADNISEETLKDRFLIRIDGSAQPKAFTIDWNVDANHHDLLFTLPDLATGDTNFLHSIEVTHDKSGIILSAFRYIRAYTESTGPFVSIVNPPEVDSVGKPYVIVLPDVASPTPEQRSYPIQVSTDHSASNVWIEFANGAGQAGKLAAVETPVAGLVDVKNANATVTARSRTLSGTVSVSTNGTAVTGSGTFFSAEVRVGNTIMIGTNWLTVTQIVNNTSLQIAQGYPDATQTNATAYLLPRFDVDFSAGSTIRLSNDTLTVSSVVNRTNLTLTTTYPGANQNGLTAYRVDPNPRISGSRLTWEFLWTNIAAPGAYTFHARVDTNGVTNTVEASATRNTRVQFLQTVLNNPSDDDDDDDGLPDVNEQNPTNYPATNSEQWNNGDVHIVYAYGKTDPLMPDTDGDGLPDGLELGWRSPSSGTDTNTDTNGDGWPNFQGDLDPPFFNTLDNYGKVPGVNSQNEGGDRARLVRGTMTDPNNPDTDGDGIPDGIEDANRNGWTDGDGEAILPNQDPSLARSWPNNVMDVGETWKETSPILSDSDNDGLSDGYGEDKNFSGYVDIGLAHPVTGVVTANLPNASVPKIGGSASRYIDRASLISAYTNAVYLETDPLLWDTDGDGLPDGWEVQYGLDPLDSGVIGQRSLRTGLIITSAVHGALGNPDGDFICNTTNAYYNLLEYQNGTHPRQAENCGPAPEGSIMIGRGTNVLGVINGVTNYSEFIDWTWDDLIVLDEYEGDGPNNQGGDTYPAWDGYDTSRDIVAFYARDGGPDTGEFYFRVDLHDLQPLAEDGYLNLYVAIDTGNPASGEMALPDDVDLITSSRWEVVVAAYKSGEGTVYVDTNPSNNSTVVTDGGNLTAFGVESRNQNHAQGFRASYYNSELDAVEFSISRQALLDAGWNGNFNALNFQVFSTKDGTCNSCGSGNTPGAGDIGGRNDVRDTIYDDHVAEDYWQAQESIQNALVHSFSKATFAGRAKVAFVVHGNQHIQPGSAIQDLINDGAGAGYHRLLAIHEVYGKPVNLHITPTLASAIQWASVDPALGQPWRDGPAFNAKIAELAQTGTVRLLASTFSDHILPYYTPEYNNDNARLAEEFLGHIYGVNFTINSVFWPPERVLDADTFSKIGQMGYQATLVDQDTHLFYWLGRTESLAQGGYQVNQINGIKTFVLNNDASNYRFQNNDNGLNMPLRGIFSRRARSGSQDQVLVVFSNWEDFRSKANADAYDRNLRWIANHPWVEVVGLDDILANSVDLDRDGDGDGWYVVDRGNVATNKLSHNYIQHAARGDYDNWYNGLSGGEHGLATNRFEIRPGTLMPTGYGMLYFGGIVSQAWDDVLSVSDTNLAKLARGAMHASGFETAFHDEDNNNLERFSIGAYVSPDTTFDNLAGFSKQAQAQTRFASIYQAVDTWAAIASSITTPQAFSSDVDLDGEQEYILYNDRVFGLFERIGGRMVAAWTRDLMSGRVFQAIGNQVANAGSETEVEGTFNVSTNGVIGAYRTSALKDWWATKGAGTSAYVNDLYTFTNWTNGWRMVSADGDITKIVTLQPKSWRFDVQYSLAGGMAGKTLYIRNGLSPNLYDLLLNGQRTLSGLENTGGVLRLVNTNYAFTVKTEIGYADTGHSASYSSGAIDSLSASNRFSTLNMRNQAQTQQTEIYGTGTFAFGLTLNAAPSDWDGDGIPNYVEDDHGFLDPENPADADEDEDDDRMNNFAEWIANTDMNNGSDYLHWSAQVMTNGNGIAVRFPSKSFREYHIWYANSGPYGAVWMPATTNAIPGTGGVVTWVDDGTLTIPAPINSTSRTYQIRVQLPQ